MLKRGQIEVAAVCKTLAHPLIILSPSLRRCKEALMTRSHSFAVEAEKKPRYRDNTLFSPLLFCTLGSTFTSFEWSNVELQNTSFALTSDLVASDLGNAVT